MSSVAAESAPAVPSSPAAGAQLIPIGEIDIPENRSRDLDPAWVEALAALIGEAGLINPITVRQTGDGYELVTGLHRISACMALGWDAVPARVSNAVGDDAAKLEEIVENIGRNELGALDRAHHLYDLQQVYERLHPEAKHGGDRKSASKDQKEIFSFRSEAAAQTGLNIRTINLYVAIWKGLSPALRLRCAGTWLARHQASLQALSDISHPRQAKVLDLLLAEPARASTVADALLILSDGRPLTPAEKKFASINKALTGLKDAELEAVLAVNAERIIETLKKMGRI